ncbi:hypothetical protein BHE17_04700 [Planococcus maritimus]|uniref:DUF3696 domain-containing protein n=1 Tax=Planococcus maritimus TaxID=192421 RepID=UPI00084C5E98|nr:DUF3696 domain-containing protein [Planococcus maritimus]OED31775.1 hypothetical protein BHE17_04700 [Planococcus maritimus]
MLITVKNFKAIESLEEYEVKSLNILSGINSGGKTSFIQFFLMIKQSLEINSLESPLILNKPYTMLGSYKDILYGKTYNNKFSFKITLDSKDLLEHRSIKNQFRRIKKKLDKIVMEFSFKYSSEKIHLETLNLEYYSGEDKYYIKFNRDRGKNYTISTNWLMFFNEDFRRGYNQLHIKSHSNEELEYGKNAYEEVVKEYKGIVYFDKFFPEFLEVKDEIYGDNLKGFSPLIRYLQMIFFNIFNNISYLGPLRDEPHSYYLNDNDANIDIGNKGENAAYILAKNSSKEITNYKIKTNQDSERIEFISTKTSLAAAVNYWICDVFKMAREIKINKFKNSTIYEIQITNNSGFNTPINHVGFGMSQVLPIIVEGLRLKEGATLVLEQPEIHLHPSIQSLLFDFLYSLTLSGKKVIVETHSDHLITRMRRRVAEDTSNRLSENINLMFIGNRTEDNYKILNMSEMGALEYWPPGFFDQYERDLKQIVKAQNVKRKLKRRKEK